MKTCPLLDNSLCKQHGCEWWIHHNGECGCAVTKIVPELFEIRKWLVVAKTYYKEGEGE